METNQELLILNLLNLYTTYVNLKNKSSEHRNKTPLNNHYALRQHQSIKALSKQPQFGSRQFVTTTKTTLLSKDKTISNSSSVAGSTSTANLNVSYRNIDTTAAAEKKNSTDTCEDISNNASITSTPEISNDKIESTMGAEMENNEENVKKKTKRGKGKNPNRKPRIRRWRVRPINMDRFKTGYQRKVFANVKKMDEQQFFEHTRMSKSLFDWLLSFVQSSLRKSKQLILAEERLVLTLNYLAYGTPLQSLAWKHKVGKSTARQIVLDTCKVLWSLLSPVYLSVPTTSQYADIAEEFKTSFYIPNCVGAIDAKNVSIRIPHQKHNSNLLVLGACDTKYKFSAVSVGNFNDQSDDGVFQLMSDKSVVISKKLILPSNKPLSESSPPFPHFFISGTSFPLLKNIMRPYTETNLDVTKSIFNFQISQARIITENTFGILTARFRVLLTTIEFLPDTCKTIILACIALHNYIMTNDEKQLYCPANFVDRKNESGIIEEGEWRNEIKNNGDKPLPSMSTSHKKYTYEAANLRDILANYFASQSISYEIEIA